jgi:T-complex protein 1 subunit eta
LEKCAATAMSSKLIHSHETFFVKMVVDAVLTLDQDELDEKLIGIKKIPGGAMQVDSSQMVLMAGLDVGQGSCFQEKFLVCWV